MKTRGFYIAHREFVIARLLSAAYGVVVGVVLVIVAVSLT